MDILQNLEEAQEINSLQESKDKWRPADLLQNLSLFFKECMLLGNEHKSTPEHLCDNYTKSKSTPSPSLRCKTPRFPKSSTRIAVLLQGQHGTVKIGSGSEPPLKGPPLIIEGEYRDQLSDLGSQSIRI